VEYTKKTNAIKLNNICFSIPKADTYDFSSKGIRKGDCMEIVHEDKSNNTSISCMGYALESYNNNYNEEKVSVKFSSSKKSFYELFEGHGQNISS
jgi:hypothetical protein